MATEAANPFQADIDKENAPLNEKEQKTWDAIHVELKDLLPSDIRRAIIVRFIRGYATEADPTKAAIDRLRECLTWRAENKVSEMPEKKLESEEKIQMFRRAWPCGLHGVGKCGRPVYVERVGHLNMEVLDANFTLEKATEFHIQTMENLDRYKDELSRKYGRLLYKHIAILDLDGVGMSMLGGKYRGTLQHMIHIDQHYFPESLHRMVIVNAPFMFKMMWAIVRPFLHPLTQARIVMGNDHLKELIDEEQIPNFLAGKCKCAGGKCLEVPFQ